MSKEDREDIAKLNEKLAIWSGIATAWQLWAWDVLSELDIDTNGLTDEQGREILAGAVDSVAWGDLEKARFKSNLAWRTWATELLTSLGVEHQDLDDFYMREKIAERLLGPPDGSCAPTGTASSRRSRRRSSGR